MSVTLLSFIDLLASPGILIDCFHLKSWFLSIIDQLCFLCAMLTFLLTIALWIWHLKERSNVDFGILNLESLIDQLWLLCSVLIFLLYSQLESWIWHLDCWIHRVWFLLSGNFDILRCHVYMLLATEAIYTWSLESFVFLNGQRILILIPIAKLMAKYGYDCWSCLKSIGVEMDGFSFKVEVFTKGFQIFSSIAIT